MRRCPSRCRFVVALCLLGAGYELLADEVQPEIVVNSGRYGPYYHLRFDLSAQAIEFSSSNRVASSGGQFELRLRPEQFPVRAPNCRGMLVLRMPWTAPDLPDAMVKIRVKRDLLARILALESDPKSTLPVVLELNPYVEVVEQDPLRLSLTHCNVFFRHARGAYIDDTGPLPR